MEFVIINGEVIEKNEAQLRNFWGDNPFIIAQKFWFGFGGIPLLEENIQSLSLQFNSFGLQLPELFLNQRELFRLSKRMLNKNKYYRSGYLICHFYLSEQKVQSVITSKAFTGFDFPITEKGIFLRVANTIKSSATAHHSLKCYNQLLWISEHIRTPLNTDESLIFLNEEEKLCEGLAANIYLLKDKVLATPAVKSGCYTDVLRPLILTQAKNLNLKVIETDQLTRQHLVEMDEIFLASEAKGIQWVLGFNNKRFIHEYADKIHTQLNQFLRNKANE